MGIDYNFFLEKNIESEWIFIDIKKHYPEFDWDYYSNKFPQDLSLYIDSKVVVGFRNGTGVDFLYEINKDNCKCNISLSKGAISFYDRASLYPIDEIVKISTLKGLNKCVKNFCIENEEYYESFINIVNNINKICEKELNNEKDRIRMVWWIS